MRVSEWVCLIFLALFMLLALIRRLSAHKRLRVIGLGFGGILLLQVATIQTVARDFAPCLIMLLIYWQGGSFLTRPQEKLQDYLERFDERFLTKTPVRFPLFWEVAYFFCYPLVPGAVAVLYALGLRTEVDFFWSIVLPPTLLCHLIVSFYHTLPPWKFHMGPPHGIVRKLNFLVIRHASIQVNTFPSAHVASCIAIAFAMLHLHWLAGVVFLFLAINITAATVIGRYHYLADALLGSCSLFAGTPSRLYCYS